jgi:hypothetical protein
VSRKSIWKVLGLEPTDDRGAIRRAYARKLKVTNPEDDAEGFQRLREAYEAALHYAEWPPHVELEVINEPIAVEERIEPAPQHSPAVEPQPPERLELERRYSDFGALLASATAGEKELLEAFDALCASSALDDVTVRLDLEEALASQLLACTPRSNRVIVRAAKLFRWGRSAVNRSPTREAAGKCANAIAYLDDLQNGRHALSAAYRALTTPPPRSGLIARLLAWGQTENVARLRNYLSVELALARPQLNADAVRWWDEYLSSPRMSKAMVAACCILPLMAAAFFLPASPPKAAGAFFGTLAVLLAIDNGRRSVQRRFNEKLPLAWRFGWLPTCAAAALVIGYLPKPLASGLIAVAVVATVWAWLVRPLSHRYRINKWELVFGNTPLAILLIGLTLRSPPTAIAAAGLVLAYHIGEPVLKEAWLTLLDSAARVTTLTALLAFSVAVGVAGFVLPLATYPTWAAATIFLLVLRRVAYTSLSAEQLVAQGRSTWSTVLIVIGLPIVGVSISESQQWGMALLNAFFLVGAVVTFTMALKNERQVRDREQSAKSRAT